MEERARPGAALLAFDVGKSSHRACAVDASGEVLFNREVANRPADIDRALAEAGAGARVVVDQKRSIGVNLPRFRLHPYAAILTAPSIFLASNSAGLRLPRAEWIPTLLQRHSMCSKISSAACSRVSKVLACAHSALMRPMGDPIAALSHGEDIDPIEGSMPASRIVLPGSSETCCEP